MSKGLSYEQLQDKTKIQKRYLQAIEEGQYSILPGAFYARAFIKNYAEAVDLDPDQLFEEYAGDLPATDQKETEFAPRSSRNSTNVPKDSKIAKILPLIFTVLLLIALLVAAYWFLTSKPDNIGSEPNQDNVDQYESEEGPEQSEEPPEESDPNTDEGNTGTDDSGQDEEGAETQSEEEEPVQEQKLDVVSSEGIVTTYALSGTDEFNVELKTKGNAYIDVRDSNGQFLKPGGKEFKSGETLTYSLEKESQVTFNIGATQNVDITVNGKALSYETSPSDRAHQKIVITFEKEEEQAQ
ncbi:RodZ domain-containing protein [Pseudalkalibacillus sp. SCS-8]|uniref:RodZ domain-containing protein n=1 Tax=Pseudalkalibacillus nanhaiensis TaxID=3115291 RepID=UPI0039C9F0E4